MTMTELSLRLHEPDILETVNRGHEAFLKKLEKLDLSDSSYPYWLSSAALNLCVNLKDDELQGKLIHADRLVAAVKKGFEQMKDLLGDLSEEERDRMVYCRSRLAHILKENLDDKRTDVSTEFAELTISDKTGKIIRLLDSTLLIRMSLMLSNIRNDVIAGF